MELVLDTLHMDRDEETADEVEVVVWKWAPVADAGNANANEDPTITKGSN